MKEGTMEQTLLISEEELEQINRLSRKKLEPEELYTFSVVLCDNEIDRDFEQFSVNTLEKLAELFVGRTGIFDHSMRGKDQKARIYSAKTEFIPGQVNRVGEPYCRLTAKAYMLRTRENEALVAEIDAGIKKEVSVGVSVEKTVCSVCGENLKIGGCSHLPGKDYGGKSCYRILDGAADAYEWSFVAVPAQPKAGVIKSFSHGREGNIVYKLKTAGGEITLSKAQMKALLEEIVELEEEAKLGETYKKELREQVVKLLPLAVPELDPEVFKNVAQVMTIEELKAFRQAFQKRKKQFMPAVPQLSAQGEAAKENFSQFKI